MAIFFFLPTLSSFLISHESLAGLLSNKGTNLICKEFWVNSKIGSGFFPKCCLKCVFVCNSVRIGQNFLKVPVESSILANCAHYHLIHSSNRKLVNSYRKDNMHGFIWNKNDQSQLRMNKKSDFLLNLSVVFLKNNWHLPLLNLKWGFHGLSALIVMLGWKWIMMTNFNPWCFQLVLFFIVFIRRYFVRYLHKNPCSLSHSVFVKHSSERKVPLKGFHTHLHTVLSFSPLRSSYRRFGVPLLQRYRLYLREALRPIKRQALLVLRYGDKAPKSVMARLFSIVWIMVGLTVCSVLTASFTTALARTEAVKDVDLVGKKV